MWGRRSKASQGGNRGEEGRCLVGRALWGFVDRGRIERVGAQGGGAQSRGMDRRTPAFLVESLVWTSSRRGARSGSSDLVRSALP
jgi:hypothetical protein